MKRLIAVFLACGVLLSACSAPVEPLKENEKTTIEEKVETVQDDRTEDVQVENENESISEALAEEEETITTRSIPDITIKGLGDEALLSYVEDSIYSSLVTQLDSEDFFVENIEAVYYPKEYIEALASNSQQNRYFGYTAAELDAQFQGMKYVFTLGEDGQTVVVPMETITDDVYIKAMENVIIGSGVILVCVTVSIVSAPVAPAVSVIFAASASTGAEFAAESGCISFFAAAIAKGYETESLEQAFKAGFTAGAEGFKWGAITGALIGGASEGSALYGASKQTVFTMNEYARIQQESGYPLDLIKQFKSYKEYEVYREAGLYTKMVNGRLALVRDIDLSYISELPNGETVTNLVRMEKGYAPIDPATGKAYQLHHINQNPNGTLAILTEAEHQGNYSILNIIGKESEIDRASFDEIRKVFWKKYAAGLL